MFMRGLKVCRHVMKVDGDRWEVYSVTILWSLKFSISHPIFFPKSFYWLKVSVGKMSAFPPPFQQQPIEVWHKAICIF